MFFGIGLLLILDTLFYFVLVPAYMITISWKLMIACAIPLPLIPFIVAKLTHTVERRFDDLQARFADVSERARESFAGAQVVKSFAREEHEARTFATVVRDYFRSGMRFAFVATLEMPALVLMLGLADLVAIVYGGALVIRGEMAVGDFAAFFQYLVRLSGPMIGLGWTIMLYQRGRASMTRLEEVFAAWPRIEDPADPVPMGEIRGGIEVRGLTFGYDEATVLRDVSFTLPPGRTLGVVGPVGSGKTTLVRLLPRLYDPPPGTVFLDGVDVRRIPLATLRGAIAGVPQEVFLFSRTIAENVADGAGRRVDREQVHRALDRARVTEDVLSLARGYDTLLGELGVNLSGGQKQRVAIARALVRDAPVLILDDCLSAVDTETERRILESLGDYSRHRTTIVVSHRVSAVRHADEILVLEDGRVAERGRHADLLARGGYYAELDRKQRIEPEGGS
jgi:ATP-binding cassette subfamily B protein